MTVSVIALDASGWAQLRAELELRQSNTVIVENILAHLAALGAQGYLVEDEYLDRDFTEAFAAYYSKLFKRHSKLCRRLHFFKADLTPLVALDETKAVAESLEAMQPDYLGFVVLRPIHQAPLAIAILLPPPTLDGYESHILVRASYPTHILGATLEVRGLPMTQQDARIGACAQATIWSAARHFHTKYNGPWISTVGITEAAMRGEYASVSSMLPNGSESLSVNGMVAALRASGRHPLLYKAVNDQQPFDWNALRPADIINRYVDSGIPVILALRPNGFTGHAVIAAGQIFDKAAPKHTLPFRPTRAEFCAGFYVNDDQGGPNLRMAIDPANAINETQYSLADLWALIIPLPDKVYLPGEKAEALAWDLIEGYGAAWPNISAQHVDDLGTSLELGNSFADALAKNQVIARTYLTYGWKYKQRFLRTPATEAVKRLARETELPKYVWITEFGTLDSFSPDNPADRQVFGHCVVDATAKNMGEDSRLFFHTPGYVLRRSHDPSNPNGPYRAQHNVIKDDMAYRPKQRKAVTRPS